MRSRCQQLSGGKHGPCRVSRFPGWHGPSPRATATCAATAVRVCPMLFIPLPFTNNCSHEEQANRNDTFPPKALLLANTSAYSPPPATLYCWFLLTKINWSLPNLGKQRLLFHLKSFLQILTSFPFRRASAGSCPPPQALFSTNAVAEQPGNLPTAQFLAHNPRIV